MHAINAQDPIQSIIWQCLDHYDYKNAIFLAERLCAESETAETIYLLATSYYRAKQPRQAYWLLKKKSCRSAQCRFLQARCAYELKEYNAAEQILTQDDELSAHLETAEVIVKKFKEISGFVWQLLAEIYRRTERYPKASEAYRQALKHNPFLWQAFAELCYMGEEVGVKETFQLDKVKCNELFSDQNNCKDESEKMSNFTPKNNLYSVPTAVCKLCSTPMCDESLNAKNVTIEESGFALLSEQFSSLTSISPVTPKSLGEKSTSEESVTKSLSQPTKANEIISKPNANANVGGGGGAGKLNVFTPAGNTPMRNVTERQPSKNNANVIETESAKENKQSAFLNKCSPRKLKYRFNKELKLDESDEDNLPKPTATKNKNMAKSETAAKHDDTQEIADPRKKVADNFMALLCDFGVGYKLLTRYQCKQAIEHCELNVPKNQLQTPSLQSMIAKCHYELQYYDQAVGLFKGIHEAEPFRFECMDIYSSCLWQLQQPVELSVLAQELIDADRLSPIAWCVAANCFSLQNDHTTAIKLMQRAVQVDPDYAYGHALLGYEHVYHEDLDEARRCFETAVLRDRRLYNGWFGIGTTYAKQQKHQQAEYYFRKSLNINPTNSVILVHIAVMQHAQQHYQQALQTLNSASKLNPDNLIAKLQRARIFFSLKRYQQALQQLEELKNIAPKEAIVFQLLGNVHQAMGQNELALMYFSWSTDMDTKKAEPFTPVLPKRSL